MLQVLRVALTATAAVLLYNKVQQPSRPRPQPARSQPPAAPPPAPIPPPPEDSPITRHSGDKAFKAALVCLLAALWLAITKQSWDVGVLVVFTSLLLVSERLTSRGNAAVAAAEVPQQPPAQVDLSGVWLKNSELSDSMDEALDLIQLNGIVRTAVRLVRGVEIKQTATQMELAVFSIISWFRVVERYDMDGAPAEWKRRDLRRGKHTGRLRVDPSEQALVLELQWGLPVAGQGSDEFFLVDADTLHVRSTLLVNERKVQYVIVYNRKQ